MCYLRALAFVAIMLVLFIYSGVAAPDKTEIFSKPVVQARNEKLGQEFNKFMADKKLNGEQSRLFSPEKGASRSEGLITDPALLAELENAALRYELTALEHRRKVLDWQHTSGQIIFWIVIVVVVSGLFFAGIQFYFSVAHTTKTIDTGGDKNNRDVEASQLEVSLTGVKVSTSVIGIVILSISLVFFYLYLLYVYPVKEIGVSPLKQTEKPK